MTTTTCTICSRTIEGTPSLLVEGTMTWLRADRASDASHLHQAAR